MVRLLKYAALAVTTAVITYIFAAIGGSLLPINSSWIAPRDGVTIYIVSNGYHTGLVLPASADGVDLSLIFRPTDLPDAENAGEYLLFGWGDRDFYLGTPSWADVRPQTLVTAMIGSGASLLHVDHLKSASELNDVRSVQLTSAQYVVLTSEIRGFARLGADGYPIALPGYGARDIFYESIGHYSLFRTCNVWTAERLAAAGVKVGRWTPFSGGVMRWFEG